MNYKSTVKSRYNEIQGTVKILCYNRMFVKTESLKNTLMYRRLKKDQRFILLYWKFRYGIR